MMQINHFINGAWRASQSEKYLEGLNPATGKVFYQLARGSANEVDLAVEAAEAAFPSWSAMPPESRAKFLDAIADGIEARKKEFAQAESDDQGKPYTLAMNLDIPRAIQNFRFFASRLRQWEQSSTQVDSETINYVLRKPRGVVALISPWNLPLYLLSWKIAPAIAVGNTAVCKPSEVTSLTAHLLTEVFQQVGLPQGVVNHVYGLGNEAGERLVGHPSVKTISFTGGTVTGQRISAAVAGEMKKLSLELGGKNPTLVFADAPKKDLYQQLVRASFLNQGEICLCGSRIYVEESFYPEFVEKFVAEVKTLRVGDPSSVRTFMGPLVSKDHMEKVKSFVQLAKDEGGQILSGGSLPEQLSENLIREGQIREDQRAGYWLAPTVIANLPESSKCIQEEIFGPVVTIGTFKTFDEAMQKANQVKYGLSASVWTENLKTAHQSAQRLQAGTVWINTWLNRDLRMPFGGTKASGVGREGGDYSFEFFTEATTVCVKTP